MAVRETCHEVRHRPGLPAAAGKPPDGDHDAAANRRQSGLVSGLVASLKFLNEDPLPATAKWQAA